MYPFEADNWWINVITPTVVIATIVYYFCTSTFKKWEKLNVPYTRPIPLFGNYLEVALGQCQPLEFYDNVYHQFSSHKYAGLFQMRTPFLMVRDPEIINEVLIKNFSHFPDRGIYSDFDVNPMTNHLFFMGNPQWKVMRSKLSPAFSSGKLKTMYDQIKECGDELMKNIDKKLIDNTIAMDIRNVIGNYSTDVIGTCIFGLKLNAINNDKSEFRKYGKMIFQPSLSFLISGLCSMITPALVKILRVKTFAAEATEFFSSAFKETIKYRQENEIVRNDFVQVLMQTRKDLVLNPNLPENEKFTETQILANAFAMFVAGFETTSSTISYCLYELALNTSIQHKVRREIEQKLSKHGGQINHEFLLELNYLDMVISETLRKYPSVVALFREASQTYQVENDSLIIEKGSKIIIPVFAIHYDSQYYTDPEKFVPERFSAEEKSKRPSGIHFPFGDGPRICLGKRFAEMAMKLALVEMLTKFEVLPCEKTEVPLTFAKNVFTLIPKNGIWLKLKRIE